MKNVLKLMLGFALTGVVYISSAQQRPQPPSPEEMLEKVTTELELSEDQVAKWEAIHEKYGDDMKSDPRAVMPKVDAEIKEILMPAQWEKFEKMKPKKRAGKRK